MLFRSRHIENRGVRPDRKPLRASTCVIGLLVPRDELEGRIERRVDTMLAAGLEDEVRQLSKSYGWDVEPMKGIGTVSGKTTFMRAKHLQKRGKLSSVIHCSSPKSSAPGSGVIIVFTGYLTPVKL